MSFDVPTLTQARTRYRDSFKSDLPGADTLLPASNLRVIGDVAGEADFEFGQYLKQQARELMVSTAVDTLEVHGNEKGVDRKPASKGAGVATATGSDGAVILKDTEGKAADGTLVIVTADVIFSGTSASVAIEAAETGAAGNLAAGVKITWTKAIVGVDATATIAEPGIAGGDDIEDLEVYRERILEAMREPPQGGDESDYVKWAKEVPGVTRAWLAAKEQGAGTVTLRFMMDNVRAAFDGIPQGTDASTLADGTGDQQLVLDYIRSRRPVTADVFVCAPIADPVDVTISGLSTDTPTVRSAILKNLKDAIKRDGVPGGTTRVSRLDEAISIATGENWHTLVAPSENIVHATGHIPTPGTVTYAS